MPSRRHLEMEGLFESPMARPDEAPEGNLLAGP